VVLQVWDALHFEEVAASGGSWRIELTSVLLYNAISHQAISSRRASTTAQSSHVDGDARHTGLRTAARKH